jgi:hypothetical protein
LARSHLSSLLFLKVVFIIVALAEKKIMTAEAENALLLQKGGVLEHFFAVLGLRGRSMAHEKMQKLKGRGERERESKRQRRSSSPCRREGG